MVVAPDVVSVRFLHLMAAPPMRRRVGIKPATVEVRFQDLSVKAGIYVGSRSMSTLLNEVRVLLIEACTLSL